MTARTATNAVTIALVALTLLPAAALAQPAPAQLAPAQPIIELHAVDATRPLRLAYADSVAYGCVEGIACTDGRGYKLALKEAMRDDPDYDGARAKKVAGIVLLSVGGGAAVLTGLIAMLAAMFEDMDYGYDEYEGYDGYDSQYDSSSGSNHTARNFGIAALCSVGVALGVGLPLLISGVSDTREIRRRAQRRLAVGSVELASGPGQAGLGLRYSF